jgi:hypothetical protein
MRETKSLTRAQARAFCRSVVVTLMVTRPDGSVAMFLAVNEMKGQHDRKVTPAASPRCHLSPFAALRVNSAKGLSGWASRCFVAPFASLRTRLSMTGLYTSTFAWICDASLDLAHEYGWTVVSIKNDWREVFEE